MTFPLARPNFAAVRFGDGQWYSGRNHIDAWERGIEAGHSYDCDVSGPWVDGYQTIHGEFVDRQEGERLMRDAGYDLDKDPWFREGDMHSKDVRNHLQGA